MTTERDIRNQIRFAEKKGRDLGAREKAIETARSFLKMGIPAETVSAGVGLTMEEVQAISKNLEEGNQVK